MTAITDKITKCLAPLNSLQSVEGKLTLTTYSISIPFNRIRKDR